MQGINWEKAALRKVCKSIRRSMDIEQRSKADRAIFAKTAELVKMIKPKQVLCYVSSPELEVDTLSLIEILLEGNIEVAVPKCIDDSCDIEFYVIKSFNCLRKGFYGILEPDTEICERAVVSGRTLCIVPGLAFDRKGRRMGFGKGYYDRFLENFSGVTLGLCYECCIRDEIPHDKHDAVMDYVITEDNIIHL